MDRLMRCAVLGLVAAQASAMMPWYPGLAVSHAAPRNIASLIASQSSNIKEYNFSVPVDHFHNDTAYEPHSDDFYPLRYWLDTSNYKPGGPVIVLAAGETDGAGRLPFLEYGIVPILTKATGGVGLILEHRYYGKSWPVENTTVENLRFLTTEQALADTAYFARHVEFPDLKDVNLTAPGTPWIIYGGSYAGAFAAFARKLYPEAYWGAISSSGVTEVITDFWQYFEAVRLYGPPGCASTTQKLTHIVDKILFGGDSNKVKQLKDMFGLAELQNDEFGSAISTGIHGLQYTMWDPEEDSAGLGTYCGTITSDTQLFSSTAYLRDVAEEVVSLGGYEAESDVLVNRLLNYIGYVKDEIKKIKTTQCNDKSIVKCLSQRYRESTPDLNGGWARSWEWQTCKQWGYFTTGTGVPEGQLPLISRAIDLEYSTLHCRRFFNITTPPDIDSINKLGGFNFSYPRLAIVDGAQDPWRAATPHAIGLPDRESTVSEPYILIDPGVHHWDEYGVREGDVRPGFPPKHIVKVQEQEVEAVKAWLKEWDDEHRDPKKQEDEFPGEL